MDSYNHHEAYKKSPRNEHDSMRLGSWVRLILRHRGVRSTYDSNTYDSNTGKRSPLAQRFALKECIVHVLAPGFEQKYFQNLNALFTSEHKHYIKFLHLKATYCSSEKGCCKSTELDRFIEVNR